MVKSVISALSSGKKYLSTVTVTPDSCPVNLLPTKLETYSETGTPK